MPPLAKSDTAKRALLAEIAFSQVARTLREAGVPVAPLKGVLWHKTLYAGEEHLRTLVDVDVLVPYHQFSDALWAMERAGFQAQPRHANPNERTLVDPALPLHIDVHRGLFAPGRYRLSTRQVFARATPDRTLYSEPVWVLDPIDQLLHLLGHFVCAHQPASARYQEDLVRLWAASVPAPGALAARAEECGMRRCVALGLGLLKTPPVSEFVAETMSALRLGPVDLSTIVGARALLQRVPPESAAASLAAHLCGPSLRHAPLSLARAWLDRRHELGPR